MRIDLAAIAIGTAFALTWSAAFTAGRIVVSAMTPLHALGLRFLIAGLFGLLFARLAGQSLRLTRAQWRAVLVFGLSQNVVYLGANFVAMQWVEASLAAIVGSTMPLLVAASGWALRGERLSPLGLAGLAGGFLGVAIIMAGRISGGVDPAGLALLALGAVALTAATLTVRSAAGSNVLTVVSMQMLVGALVLLPLAPAVEGWSFTPSLRFGLAATFLVFGSSLLGTWLWFRLVLRIGAIRAATFHFLNPAFGVGIAALMLGEHVEAADVIGTAIVAAGILAVQLSRQRPSGPVQPGSSSS